VSFNTQAGEYSRVNLQIVVVHSTAEFFGPTGTPELTTQERHIVVALILVDQFVSPLFVSRSQFI